MQNLVATTRNGPGAAAVRQRQRRQHLASRVSPQHDGRGPEQGPSNILYVDTAGRVQSLASFFDQHKARRLRRHGKGGRRGASLYGVGYRSEFSMHSDGAAGGLGAAFAQGLSWPGPDHRHAQGHTQRSAIHGQPVTFMTGTEAAPVDNAGEVGGPTRGSPAPLRSAAWPPRCCATSAETLGWQREMRPRRTRRRKPPSSGRQNSIAAVCHSGAIASQRGPGDRRG